MKLSNLIEAKPFDDGLGGENPDVPDEWFEWIKDHKATIGEIRPKAWSVKNGELCCLKTRVLELGKVTDETLPPFKLGEMGNVTLTKTCKFSDLSWLPTEVDHLALTTAKIKSIKGLSKKCRKVTELILTPYLESGLLEIFKLNGLKKLTAFLSSGNGDDDPQFADAFHIVHDIWTDGGDALDAQFALQDTGLERFQ